MTETSILTYKFSGVVFYQKGRDMSGKRKPPQEDKQVLCDHCDEAPAAVQCDKCQRAFFIYCDKSVHETKNHKRKPFIQAEHLDDYFSFEDWSDEELAALLLKTCAEQVVDKQHKLENVRLVGALISEGVDIDATFEGGVSPLCLALEYQPELATVWSFSTYRIPLSGGFYF